MGAFYMIQQPIFNIEPMTSCGIRRRNLMKEFLAEAFENYCEQTDSENEYEVCMITDDAQDKKLKTNESRNENDQTKELIEAKKPNKQISQEWWCTPVVSATQ